MADKAKRVFPYGVNSDPAAYVCVDCGLPYRHKKVGRLPPCNNYNEGTHGRAGWHKDESEDGVDQSPPGPEPA